MATNPALLLHERLTAWANTPSNQQPIVFRGGEDGNWVEPHLETLRWALEVRARLDALAAATGPSADDEEFFAAILIAIFTANGLRTAVNGGQMHISKENLRALRMLGVQWQATLDVDATVLAEVAAIADETIELATVSTHLSQTQRNYLLDVAQNLKKAVVEVTAFGTADVHRLAAELAGALVIYLGQTGDGEAGKAGGLVYRLMNAVKYNLTPVALAAIGGVGAGVGEQIIAAITQ